MSIALLKTLVAIADLGRFSGAAKATHVTQAAVGQQMKRLEQTLRVTLFDRSHRTPQLGPLGPALVPRARDLIQGHESLLDPVRLRCGSMPRLSAVGISDLQAVEDVNEAML